MEWSTIILKELFKLRNRDRKIDFHPTILVQQEGYKFLQEYASSYRENQECTVFLNFRSSFFKESRDSLVKAMNLKEESNIIQNSLKEESNLLDTHASK